MLNENKLRVYSAVLWRKFQNSFTRLRHSHHTKPKIIVLGNQKSGTTAFGFMLAKRGSYTYSNDPLYFGKSHIDTHTSSDEQLLQLQKVIHKLPFEFSKGVIKEPDFSLLIPSLRAAFPETKIVFITRNPFANIKSILDRLNIDGNIDQFKESDWEKLSKYRRWREILDGTQLGVQKNLDFVGNLAVRWNTFEKSRKANQDVVVSVSYEEFRTAHTTVIDHVLDDLDIPSSNRQPIEQYVNRQFQHKGKTKISIDKFFGEHNLSKIEKICKVKRQDAI